MTAVRTTMTGDDGVTRSITKGQTTKQCFVVCALGSRRVAATRLELQVSLLFYLFILLITIYRATYHNDDVAPTSTQPRSPSSTHLFTQAAPDGQLSRPRGFLLF